MTKIQKIMLILILILLGIFYAVWNKENNKKSHTKKTSSSPIVIEPLIIEPKNPKYSQKEIKSKETNPLAILSKLEEASKEAKVMLKPDKDEEALNILTQLKKQTKAQIHEVPKKVIVQKKIIKKPKVKKVIKKKIKKVKIAKKVVNSKKTLKPKPKKNITKIRQIAVKRTLSREEEVAAYHRQYTNKLEVVSVSKPFKIKETHTIPDAAYFEPVKQIKENPNAPIKFVKKLGVVGVSSAYESTFNVPKKVELAKEGLVDIPSATLETEEMKRLRFVEPLEVVEVSPNFESIEAKKYIH